MSGEAKKTRPGAKRRRSKSRVRRNNYSDFDKFGIQSPKGKQRKKQRRVLVDHNKVAPPPLSKPVEPPEPENELEKQRLERIRRNQAIIAQLELPRLAAELHGSFQPAAKSGRPAAQPRPRQQPKPRVVRAVPPARKSGRQRGLEPSGASELPAAEDEADDAGLMTSEAYFKARGMEVEGRPSDGRFTGWVNPEICERYGLAASADAAWEANGGGSFSRRVDPSAVPASLKGRGWSDARAFAHTQLQKNPNAFFYRHVAPHEQQAQGEWTSEEHTLFLETARKHGVGDKWGLFSSYIPQRVGYQCSAYYRDVILPQGLFFDPKFRLTPAGKAVYVG